MCNSFAYWVAVTVAAPVAELFSLAVCRLSSNVDFVVRAPVLKKQFSLFYYYFFVFLFFFSYCYVRAYYIVYIKHG